MNFLSHLTRTAARDVSALNLSGVPKLVFVNSPNGVGKVSNKSSRDGGNGHPVIIKHFYDIPEGNKRNVIRTAIFVRSIIGLMTYFCITRK